MEKSLKNVDAYIKHAPEETRGKLQEVRALIRAVAPDAVERTDYFEIPGYSYEGYDYDGMFVWFSFNEQCVRLHVRPPVLQNHEKELAPYKTTKAIVNFPLDQKLPTAIIKKLVKESIQAMKNKGVSNSNGKNKTRLW